MLTAHCRRAAGLSSLQINGPTYYFPNCPLAQLAVWGTSSSGMNTVAPISSRGPVQAYAMLVPNCVCEMRHLHIHSGWNVGSLSGKNLKEREEKTEQINSGWFRLFDPGEGHCCTAPQLALAVLLSGCYSREAGNTVCDLHYFQRRWVLYFWRGCFLISLILSTFRCVFLPFSCFVTLLVIVTVLPVRGGQRVNGPLCLERS